MDRTTKSHFNNLIVGDDNCKYIDIMDILTKLDSMQFWEGIFDLGRSLDVPNYEILSLQSRLLNNLISHPGCLSQILETWRGMKANHATLSVFIFKLEDLGLKDCADALREHFDQDNSSPLQKTTANESTLSDLEQPVNSNHIADANNKLLIIKEVKGDDRGHRTGSETIHIGNTQQTVLVTSLSGPSIGSLARDQMPVFSPADVHGRVSNELLEIAKVSNNMETEDVLGPKQISEGAKLLTLHPASQTLNDGLTDTSDASNGIENPIVSSLSTSTSLEHLEKINQPILPQSETLINVPGTIVRYDPLNKLGNGATSNVYDGYYGNIPAAVKLVLTEHFELYKNEIFLWEDMKKTTEEKNLNIVTLLLWQELKTSKYIIVMERAICDLNKRIKDLQHLRKDRSQLKPNELIELATEQERVLGFIHGAAKGLNWMHGIEKAIIHRDIKPENILIFKTRSGEIAKLGDFGISRKLTNTSAGTTTGGKGTLDWMAPEAIRAYQDDEPYKTTKAVDIFSLGLTAHFAISMGVHPFGKSSKYGKIILMNISDADVSPINLGHPHYAADHLLKWMMDKSVEGRPNLLQVVQHPCFWDWKKSQDFICSVARCFDGKHDDAIQNDIDDEYRKQLGSQSNWVEKLDAEVKAVLFSYKKKNYTKDPQSDSSVMKLVELMRDKFMHYRDMVKTSKLISNDAFTIGGRFDGVKYWEYFFVTFPEVITHLFCQIANRKHESLGFLQKEHFEGFENVPDWAQYAT